MQHVEISQNVTPATRNDAMQSWKARKVTPFAKLTTGTAIYSPHAIGCERLRAVAQRLANTAQPPHPQRNGNPCYAFGKKMQSIAKDVTDSGFALRSFRTSCKSCCTFQFQQADLGDMDYHQEK